jgi:hypothetical protein
LNSADTESTVSTKAERVATSDGGVLARCSLVESVPLSLTSALLSVGRQTTSLSVLVDGVDDPADSWVSSDCVVRWVNSNDFVVLVYTILVDPVTVQDSQISTLSSDSLLSSASQASLVLEMVDTVVNRLSVGGSLGYVLLAVTTTNSNSVDDESLLRSVRVKSHSRQISQCSSNQNNPLSHNAPVSQSTSLVGAGRSRSTVNHLQLSVLPASYSKQESEQIRLLLGLKGLQVFVCTHLINEVRGYTE